MGRELNETSKRGHEPQKVEKNWIAQCLSCSFKRAKLLAYSSPLMHSARNLRGKNKHNYMLLMLISDSPVAEY